MKSLSSLLLLALLLTGCTKSTSYNGQVPIVKVDNEVLTAKAFAEKLALEMRGYDAAAAKLTSNVNRVKDDIIHAFMISVVVKKYAEKNGISVSQEEFETEFNKVRKGYASDLAFKSSLANSGLLVDEWKEEFRKSLLQKKVFEQITANTPKKPDNGEAKQYYQSHYSQFVKPAEVRIAQIVVSKLEEIEKIQKLLRSGKYSFEEMAKKYSLSPDAAAGGDAGFIAKGAVPAFDAAFNMSIGQLSGVIKSSYGYHLMKVLAKKPPTKISFDLARPGIIKMFDEQNKEAAFNAWLIDSLKTLKVEKNNAVIEKIKVYTQGSYE